MTRRAKPVPPPGAPDHHAESVARDPAPASGEHVAAVRRDMLDHLRRTWGFTGDLTWRETGPDSWVATC
ncbi:hypothetical protein [Actinoplanes couchii]|uniref:Uncharacterized protein n=1 Tax=Actinoplanes couchii TaxID=403638 RepID=A0ABQ3XHI2_9ACTN|nr:hypothetical protein [Actinoplanes couchii]MDR6317574.1 hypothetical protein [Actinoplanes couchii]GID57959.1 hypothetical protein Aco03nite_063630 [Actinoplanes couchii]